MKKLVLMVFLILIFLVACSKSNETRWVNTNAGLKLRLEPSTESKQIDLIPDGEQVVILNKNKDEVSISNVTGRWVQIQWNEKTGWVFDGFLTNQNLNKWVTTKTGLPYYNDQKNEYGIIPSKEKVKFIAPGKPEGYVIVNWRGDFVSVRGEFLSDSNNIIYNYTDLREVASKKLTNSQKDIIHPEDMYIDANAWLFHVIYISRNQDDEKDYLESLWIKDNNIWKEIELYGSNHDAFRFKMYNLDEDENPDIMMYGGCCDSGFVEVFLGTPDKKLNKIFEAHGTYYPSDFNPSDKTDSDAPIIISDEKCEKTIIEFKNKQFKFDCKKKQFI